MAPAHIYLCLHYPNQNWCRQAFNQRMCWPSLIFARYCFSSLFTRGAKPVNIITFLLYLYVWYHVSNCLHLSLYEVQRYSRYVIPLPLFLCRVLCFVLYFPPSLYKVEIQCNSSYLPRYYICQVPCFVLSFPLSLPMNPAQVCLTFFSL